MIDENKENSMKITIQVSEDELDEMDITPEGLFDLVCDRLNENDLSSYQDKEVAEFDVKLHLVTGI